MELARVGTSVRLLLLWMITMISSFTHKGVLAFGKHCTPPQRSPGIRFATASVVSRALEDFEPSPGSKPQQQHPRAAVAVALRCVGASPVLRGTSEPPLPASSAHYLLIRRGNEPNRGSWALPGGKLEWGESTLAGARRELREEVEFLDPIGVDPAWCPEPYGTVDSVSEGFHYLIALCFAEVVSNPPSGQTTTLLPKVAPADDAIDARWWSLDDIEANRHERLSKSLVARLQRTESLHRAGVLPTEQAGGAEK